MGRTKGSKNKPKLKTDKPTKTVKPAAVIKPQKQVPITEAPELVTHKTTHGKDHVFFRFVDYAISKMQPIELRNYQNRARKTGLSVEHLVCSSLQQFFLIQDNKLKL